MLLSASVSLQASAFRVVSLSVHLEFDGEVVLDSRHYARDKFEEEEKTTLDARLPTIALDLVDHLLHHCGVIAGMYAELVSSQLGVSFKSDCLSGVVCHDVLEHFVLRQKVTILTVALEP